MSHDINTQILEERKADFDTFLGENDFESAKLVVEDLSEQGFIDEVAILKGKLANGVALFQPMDERDLDDRSYPKQ